MNKFLKSLFSLGALGCAASCSSDDVSNTTFPTDYLSLSDECRQELSLHGVLINDKGVPAGRALMQKPEIKIAIIEDVFSEDLREEITKYRQEDLGIPSQFPQNIEAIIRDAISFWYDGNIFHALNIIPIC